MIIDNISVDKYIPPRRISGPFKIDKFKATNKISKALNAFPAKRVNSHLKILVFARKVIEKMLFKVKPVWEKSNNIRTGK